MKKKILIIVQNNPVPFDDRVWKEAVSLRKADYEVTVLCPKGKGAKGGYELLEGVHIYRHPIPKERNSALAYVWEYGWALLFEIIFSWWIYLRRGFHVIQGCNPPDDIFLVALPFRLFGVKYIFDHHDVNPELYLSKYGRKDLFYIVQTWLEKLTFRFSDVVISTNNSYRHVATTRGSIAPEDVFVVRNGPDLKTFKPVPPIPDLKYGKRYLVGYVGVMSVQEGLDILLEVARRIKDLGRRDVHFTCVGGGPALAGLRKMVQDKDLGDMVNFTGRVPFAQLLEVLSTADVCVNPDKPCPMNDMSTMIKIMEYMALGKPIVQFDLKEGRFSAQEASLYSDNENQVADFADKILWLLDHPSDRQKMGEFGRKRVQEELAWEYSAPTLLAAYERAFSKEKGPNTAAEGQPPLSGDWLRRESGENLLRNHSFLEYFKCSERHAGFSLRGPLSATERYFHFGSGNVCYGHVGGPQNGSKAGTLSDVVQEVAFEDGSVQLPFDLDEVVDNLRCERYPLPDRNEDASASHSLTGAVYYCIRPLLPVGVRKYLQRVHLRGWDQIAFPRWPVDRTVDDLFQLLMIFSLESRGIQRIPFIWFWPDGAPSSAIMTHDVETDQGRDSCGALMDIDDAYGIKASFEVVPEQRYEVPRAFLDSITQRGFEVAVHDLNHDGRLYKSREQFAERVAKINSYRRDWEVEGFRAAVLYRRQEWFSDLEFSYDMSVPNVAHLDPQRGGCCTVMPYFIGNLLEIPVTATQDYTLFHILQNYSTDLWKSQIELIMEKHGVLSFIVHPDYATTGRERKVYEELLSHLDELRRRRGIWFATPGEVNRWWRQRAAMRIVEDDEGVRIEGSGSERARIAYASVVDGRLAFDVESAVAKQRV